MERHCYSCPVAEEGIVCGQASSQICVDHIAKMQQERAAVIASIKVRTENVYPPIPVRQWDWSAVDDNTYEPGCPIGWGRTEQAAIDDLGRQGSQDAKQPGLRQRRKRTFQALDRASSVPHGF